MIIPKNWSKFQHYKKRKPPWIKLHRDLLDDHVFNGLPDASRALAPMLWLIASERLDGVIPLELEALAFRLHIASDKLAADLKPLISAGYFEDASNMLASCKQDASNMLAPETETETETETDIPNCSNSVPAKVYVYEKGKVKLTKADYQRWEAAFKNINLMAELEAMAEWAEGQSNWFVALSAALAKKDAAARDRLARIQAEVAAGAKRPVTGGGYA